MEKVEWHGYPRVKKFGDMSSRLDSIPSCDRRTYGQTDGQTGILQQHQQSALCIASRGKNGIKTRVKVNEQCEKTKCYVECKVLKEHRVQYSDVVLS